jgi:transcriptional regulator GlxA family with amidase domain
VKQALLEFQTSSDVREVARLTGYSERRLSSLFREAVGLSPKVYTRLQRFQVALNALHTGSASMGQIASHAGYADQAHFAREFREFAALTPKTYRNLAPVQARHVPFGH